MTLFDPNETIGGAVKRDITIVAILFLHELTAQMIRF